MSPPSLRSAHCAEDRIESSALTELQGRVAELEAAVAARDHLIGLIGHELRNPLSPVFLQAHHLLAEVKRKPPGESVSPDWLLPRLELFLRGLDRLLDRLNRLMDVAVLQSRSSVPLVEEDIDLCEVVADVIGSLSGEALAAACPLSLLSPGVAMGRWDRVRLEQIAGNLISNAIRHGCGTSIEVEIQSTPTTVELSVRDHGPGIAAELEPSLFDRFQQVNPGPHKGGLGLGLWITRRLCEAMGGTLSLESQPGQGATFVVRLPCGQLKPND